jgi:hypothetical protein
MSVSLRHHVTQRRLNGGDKTTGRRKSLRWDHRLYWPSGLCEAASLDACPVWPDEAQGGSVAWVSCIALCVFLNEFDGAL